MTPKKRQREAPLSVRLKKEERLRLMDDAAAAGMIMNAYAKMMLFSKKPRPLRGAAPLDRKALSAAMGTLGALTTSMRLLVKMGLLDIFPSLEPDLRLTFQKIRETCDAIMSALGSPGDST